MINHQVCLRLEKKYSRGTADVIKVSTDPLYSTFLRGIAVG
jgi:hypothetical protein